MLRFNNNPISKPVDFYRPLTVDVSVEYELPKEVAPPPGSAPLLIIHPSANIRSKFSQPSSSSHHHHSRQNPRSNSSSHAQFATRTSKQESIQLLSNDLNSTLRYLTRGTTSQDPVGTGRYSSEMAIGLTDHVKNLRPYGMSIGPSNNGNSLSGLISRGGHISGPSDGRNCSYRNGDEYGKESPLSGYSVQNKKISSNLAANRKASQHQMQFQQHTMDRLDYCQHSESTVPTINLNNNNSPNTLVVSGLSGKSFFGRSNGSGGMAEQKNLNSLDKGLKGFAGAGATITAAASNKRLRMMNRHQQHQHLNLLQQQHCNPPSISVEPLNLAITSSTLLNSSCQSNQFSTFSLTNRHAQARGNSVSTQVNVHPSGISGLHYAAMFPQNHSNPLISSTITTELYASRLQSTKDPRRPVTVDKGSGSGDSGVCSENDSDVSPPMPHPFAGQSRRSFLAQELPDSGCYCCCCPTTASTTGSSTENALNSTNSTSSTTTSRKISYHSSSSRGKHQPHNSNSKMNAALAKSHFNPVNNCLGGSSGSKPGNEFSATCSSPMNARTARTNQRTSLYRDGDHGQEIGNLSSMALGNSHFSPLDSTSVATAYRKWSGLAGDSTLNSTSPSLGRWFQV